MVNDPSSPPFNLEFTPGSADDPRLAQSQAIIQAAITGSAPKLYANAIGLALTPSDVILTAVCNGTPVCVLNLGLPTAAALMADLKIAIDDYERTSEQKVKSSGEINEIMQRVRAAAAQETKP